MTTYETSERSHRHCFNDQEGHEKHLACCICQAPNTFTTENLIEDVEIIINRFSPLENLDIKYACAKEIVKRFQTAQEETLRRVEEGVLEDEPDLQEGTRYVDGFHHCRQAILSHIAKMREEFTPKDTEDEEENRKAIEHATKSVTDHLT